MKETRDHIGMFDSGVGGLSVMKEVKAKLPQENIIYFGDTARVPYGGKSRDTIIRYSIENAIFLMEQNIKMLVIACNTASAYAVEKLSRIFNIPIIDVIEPGAERAAKTTKSKKIAVVGTKGTISSGAYQKALNERIENAEIFAIACPLLVPLVEERFIDHPACELIIKDYLEPLKNSKVDTILLGCTHYPILKDIFTKIMGPDVQIVDSASTCAEKVSHVLTAHSMKRNEAKGTYKFYVSDDPQKFKIIGKHFLNEEIFEVDAITHSGS